MFLAILLIMQGQTAPALDSKVTLDIPVGRADRALDRLGEKAGIALKTTSPVGDEIVFLHIQDRPVRDVMDHLARVTRSTWQPDSKGGYILSRSSAVTKAEFQKEVHRKAERLKSWYAGLRKGLSVSFTKDGLASLCARRAKLQAREQNSKDDADQRAAHDELQISNYADPMYRVLTRCLDGVDFYAVASLPAQAAIVYSTDPNAIQLPLGSEAHQGLELLQPEQALWGQALKAMPLAPGEDAEHRFFGDFGAEMEERHGMAMPVMLSMGWQRTLPFRRKPVVAVIKASCYSDESYRFDLTLLDAEGKQVLKLDGDPSTFENVDPVPLGLKNLTNPEPSEESATLARIMNRNGQKADPKDIAKLKRFFEDPIENEPLGIGNQELLTAVGKAKDKSVVACMPDSATQMFAEKLDLAAFLSNPNRGVTIRETDGWVEFEPQNFAQHWADHADRKAMAACHRALKPDGNIEVIAFAKLLATCGPNPDQNFSGRFVEIENSSFRSFYRSYDLPFQSAFIKLLADLKPSQLDRLRKGETIPYRELSSDQQQYVARIIYGIRVNTREEGNYPTGLAGVDATFELPRGLLEGAGLSAAFETHQVVTFHNQDGGFQGEFYRQDLSDGGPSFWSGSPPRTPVGGMANATVDIRDQQRISLKCALRPGHFAVGNFVEPLPDSGKRPIPISELPKEILDKLKHTIEFLDRLGGNRQRQESPPPPKKL